MDWQMTARPSETSRGISSSGTPRGSLRRAFTSRKRSSRERFSADEMITASRGITHGRGPQVDNLHAAGALPFQHAEVHDDPSHRAIFRSLPSVNPKWLSRAIVSGPAPGQRALCSPCPISTAPQGDGGGCILSLIGNPKADITHSPNTGCGRHRLAFEKPPRMCHLEVTMNLPDRQLLSGDGSRCAGRARRRSGSGNRLPRTLPPKSWRLSCPRRSRLWAPTRRSLLKSPSARRLPVRAR